MDTLQDFLTLIATAIEYFFFAYLAVALMVYSLKPLAAVQLLCPTGSDRFTQVRHLRVWLVSAEPESIRLSASQTHS